MNTAANNNETQSGTGVALVNAGGVYALSLTRGSDSSVNTDVTMGITAANATLSASTTTAFKSGTANAVNNWASVCTVYCNSGHASDVTVTFTYHSGTTYRIVGNGFKFDYLGQPISFSTQPAGTASATAGGSVSIGPVATTGPLGGTTTYQWKKNGVNVSGAEYSGGTGTTLTINPATTGDSGTYTCVATSTTCGTATSSGCVVTVSGGMSFTTPPAATASVNQGSSVSIGPVAATGCGTINYQWQVNHGSGAANVSGSEYQNATTTTLTINPAIAGDAGTYTCVASGSGCGPNVSSSGCSLTVYVPPAAPTAAATSAESDTGITWNWTDGNSDQTGYKVYDAASGGNLKATISGAGTTTWAETGLTKGTTYSRWVTAYNSTSGLESTRILLPRTILNWFTATWHPINNTVQATCNGDTYIGSGGSLGIGDSSYVTSTTLGCGYNSTTGDRRMMVQFDQSAMPGASLWKYGSGNANIQNLYVTSAFSGNSYPINGYKITSAWDETTVLPTWNTFSSFYNSTLLMSGNAAEIGSTASFAWDPFYGMPDAGKGIMFINATEGVNTYAKIFASKENTSGFSAAAMSLNYYLPGTPGWITRLLVLPGIGDASIDTATYATAAGLTGDTDMYGSSTKSYGGKTWTAYTGDTTDVAGFSNNYGWNLANSPYNMGVNICALFNLYVHSDVTAGGCYLRCGSDDGVRLIVNGTTVGTDDTARGWAMEQSVFGPFNMNAGWNRVLIKVRNGSGGTGLKAVRFSNADASVWSGSTLTYAVDDTTAPSNPTACTESGGAISGVCQGAVSSPSFSWSGTADTAVTGEGASGVRGYLVYFGPSASGTPSGTIQTGTTFAPGAQTPGTYYLRVITVDNAMNQSAATTLFTFQYSPAAPTAGSDSPICAGSTLHLTASTVSGATYAWTGPNGFTSSTQNPTIASATTAVTGLYSVTATVNGCTSTPGTTSVTVNGATTSAISGSTAVAANQLGKIYFVTLTSGSSYAWTVPSGATITAGATGPNNNQITVNFGSTSGNVTVTETTAASCVGTPVSLGVSVTGNQAPVAPPNKTLSTAKNTAATFDTAKLLAGATDADGDTLTVTAANTTTAGAAVLLEAGDVKYTPPTGFTGSDSYTYTIDDGHGGTAVGTVNVTVTANSGGSPNVVGDPTYDSGTGKFSVTFAGIPGVEYTVEYAEGSAAPPWNKLMNITAGSDGLFVVEDTAAQSPGRYYRTVYPSY